MARDGGGRPTVESARALDVRDFTRLRILDRAGETFSTSLEWSRESWDGSGPIVTGRAKFLITVQDGDARVMVEGVTANRPWEGGLVTLAAGQVLDLVSRPVHFGGRRWFFICPLTGDLALRLYLPLGAQRFGSRKGYRLGYACQRESKRDQAMRRARKAREKIGGSVDLSQRLPGKPKWMRWPTYWRLRAEAGEADGVAAAGLAESLKQIAAGRSVSV